MHAVRAATEVLTCMSIQEIREAMLKHRQLQELSPVIINGWPHARQEVS